MMLRPGPEAGKAVFVAAVQQFSAMPAQKPPDSAIYAGHKPP
jgi:hypothetical protein